jgi:pimeloyl-ACP methyl ester carboxylesterase
MVFEPDRSRRLVGEDIGDEDSPHLFLCLPGLLETRQSFEEFVTYVSPHARIMTLDWCGRGDSQRLDAVHEYRMSVYLSDLSLFYSHAMGTMSGSRTPRIHLVGTSMGGLLAVVLASHKPKQLGTVILNDVGPLLPWGGVFSLMTSIGQAKSGGMSMPPDIGGIELAERLDVDPQLLRAVRQPSHLDLPHETRLSGVDFSSTFAAVTAPMLLLRGADSEIINDAVVKRILQLHPLTRIHECHQSAHPVRYSADVCAAILSFVRQH